MYLLTIGQIECELRTIDHSSIHSQLKFAVLFFDDVNLHGRHVGVQLRVRWGRVPGSKLNLALCIRRGLTTRVIFALASGEDA